MLLANNRIEIDARPKPPAARVLEVVMLGHCPGRALWQRLAADELLLNKIAALGFARQCNRLRELFAGASAHSEDAELLALYKLPIPLHSFGQFQALFPDAFDGDTHYFSLLAGNRAWLPLAVQDFFANAEAQLTLWVIRLDETQQQAAFLPTPGADMLEPDSLGALERALLIPHAGLLAFPDLERLQIPARLPDIPRLRIDNIDPVFMPCGTHLDDSHRERRYGNEIPDMPEPLATRTTLLAIVRCIAAHRPDMLCLYSLALDSEQGNERPGVSQTFIADISQALANGELSQSMRHVQLVYPYLRGRDRKLSSAVGMLAGKQADVCQQHGPWRSIAERTLHNQSLAWPPVSPQQASQLRDAPGVTVLVQRAGRLCVDDERLCAPCLNHQQLAELSSLRRSDDHWRSAEIMRFMGWIRRELLQLGEKMIFDIDPSDPRPIIALRNFFSRLYAQGALRGASAEEAFSVVQRHDGSANVSFDIEVAPAYPIDRLRITFMQDRHSGVNVEVGNVV